MRYKAHNYTAALVFIFFSVLKKENDTHSGTHRYGNRGDWLIFYGIWMSNLEFVSCVDFPASSFLISLVSFFFH